MSNHIENQIKERIVTFVHELDVLVRRSTLEALKSVLDGGSSTPARRGPGRPRGGGSAVGGNVTSAIVEHVRSNDGQTVGEIAAAVRAAPKLVKKAIIQLLGSGALKKTGQKRGTRYHIGSGTPAPAAVKKGKRGKRKGKKARKAKAA
ncbi:MAG: hypothetical protein HOP15_02820 [Planctomycetes bacterium]|nr:hypothetical protein [Planctomycetota bacterium]